MTSRRHLCTDVHTWIDQYLLRLHEIGRLAGRVRTSGVISRTRAMTWSVKCQIDIRWWRGMGCRYVHTSSKWVSMSLVVCRHPLGVNRKLREISIISQHVDHPRARSHDWWSVIYNSIYNSHPSITGKIQWSNPPSIRSVIRNLFQKNLSSTCSCVRDMRWTCIVMTISPSSIAVGSSGLRWTQTSSVMCALYRSYKRNRSCCGWCHHDMYDGGGDDGGIMIRDVPWFDEGGQQCEISPLFSLLLLA